MNTPTGKIPTGKIPTGKYLQPSPFYTKRGGDRLCVVMMGSGADYAAVILQRGFYEGDLKLEWEVLSEGEG